MTGTGARALMLGAALVLGSTAAAAAQARPTTGRAGARPTAAGRPAAGRGTARGATGTPRKDAIKERAKNATPEQKAYLKSLAEEQKKIREGVKAGTLDRKSAAAELKAWRDAHPAPKKPTP